MKYIYLYTFLVSSGVSLLLILLLEPLSRKFNVLMIKGIPSVGGPAVSLALMLAVFCGLTWMGYPVSQLGGLFFSSLLLLVVGIGDDLFELGVVSKLLFQTIAAALIIATGIRTSIAGIGLLSNIVITYIWLMVLTNSFNLLDILDGLLSSIVMVISCSFLMISLFNNDPRIALISLAVIGSTIPFMFFNFPPARIFMGNSGSHFLGFFIGAVAILISYATMERRTALFSPLLILWFPLFDTILLVMLRLFNGKSVLRKSKHHLAMIIQANGYSKKMVLLAITLLCLFFALLGICLVKLTMLQGVFVLAIAVLVSFGVFFKAMKLSRLVCNETR